MGVGMKMVKIDGQKLGEAISKRNLQQVKVSQELGFEKSYMAHAKRKNIIAYSSMRMLEVLYGIKPEEYEYHEPEPEPEVLETMEEGAAQIVGSNIDAKLSESLAGQLYRLIYSAVYEAVDKVLNEPYKKNEESF